ncbi:PiggyBac transposable element-derived protein 4 [Cucumispora dikerogammari]|nr:PiggyBac transposable element-derived protein 4 [Cucumispora dikerogammari]
MMAFKGKMKNRVYNPMKSDKWGIKFYICAGSKTSYVLNLRIYGEYATLNRTVHDLTVNLTGKNRKLFMDNYYNSFDLAKKLYNSGIYSCGTLRSRRGGPENLNSIKKNSDSWKKFTF